MKLPLLTLAAITTLALACTSDEPLATPSPSPTPTPELTATPTLLSPTPSPTPTKTPTASATPVDRTRSLKAVDQVISAVEAGDVDALESLVTYTNVTCKPGTALVAIPYPSCGSPPSRLVPAFPAGVCAYVWHAKPRPMLEHFVERAGPLFAVIEGPAYLVDFGIVDASPGSPGD
ncbi:MAG: hypothetical protein HOH95_08495, partial [Dehalococcoidia bacterium]|nr:hypothetical protein [Dehalococcoidia bacterium]